MLDLIKLYQTLLKSLLAMMYTILLNKIKYRLQIQQSSNHQTLVVIYFQILNLKCNDKNGAGQIENFI